MANALKTVVATGASSGIGFELVKQLLQQSQPYRIILGCRNTATVTEALNSVNYDSHKHLVTLLPLELSDLKTVRSFASQAQQELGATRLDYLLLNAALVKSSHGPGPNASKWCEQYVVNHLSQHYLTHLLRKKIEESHSRVVVVSSGAIRMITDTSSLRPLIAAQSNKDGFALYPATKFIQLLNALWWRRQLQGSASVVVVSPGLIPSTGLARHLDAAEKPQVNMADAKSVPEGAQSILQAFTRDDLPDEADRIFLTSWGEWWDADVYKLALDKSLQDEWSPSLEVIEKEENVL